MSRAGKFIPGGAGNKPAAGGAGGGRTGPIRAPEPGSPTPEPALPSGKRTVAKGSSLVKPVAKSQRMPIVVMSAVVCCLLVSFAWYEFAVVPAQRAVADAQSKAADVQKQLAETQADLAKQQADLNKKTAAALATLTVDSKPPNADIIIGNEHKSAPATFDDLPPGTVTVMVKADGYEESKQDVTVSADKPTDLGTIALVLKAGSLSLTSPQSEVEYTITGPNDYSHQGTLPDKLDALPVGDYQLTAWQHDWKLAPVTITIQDKDNVQKEIKFPYGQVAITSTPSGATVRQGRTILGQTPITLPQLHPGELKVSLDLAPYTLERLTVDVPEFGSINKAITMTQGRDFIAACGMAMVWIPDGRFWAGKYPVRQSELEAAGGSNPSYFRRPNRPVEQISWENAMAFCDLLTAYERKAGRLPAGYHYTLPLESQWALFSADADIELAAMSREGSLSSTQEVGYSEPNKYGLYDTLGNVWEWCLDTDDRGDHSIRGGCWLSSASNFPNADTRQVAVPKTADRFTGFRVVLMPQ